MCAILLICTSPVKRSSNFLLESYNVELVTINFVSILSQTLIIYLKMNTYLLFFNLFTQGFKISLRLWKGYCCKILMRLQISVLSYEKALWPHFMSFTALFFFLILLQPPLYKNIFKSLLWRKVAHVKLWADIRVMFCSFVSNGQLLLWLLLEQLVYGLCE